MKKKIVFETLNLQTFLRIIVYFRNHEIFIVEKNSTIPHWIFYNILKHFKIKIRYFNKFYAGDIKFRGEAITLHSLKFARKVIPKIFKNISNSLDFNKNDCVEILLFSNKSLASKFLAQQQQKLK